MIRYNSYTLSPESIATITGEITEYMNKIGENSIDTARVSLTVEELLIRISQKSDSDVNVRVGFGKKFRRHTLNIFYDGESFDPTDTDDDEWSHRLLTNLGLSPAWAYHGKTNRISMLLKERTKISSLVAILIALLASVILGVCGAYIPQNVKHNISELILNPASEAFLGLLKTFAGFMIAFTVCSGILGMGSTDSLKNTGRRVLLRFILISFVFSTATTLLCLPFFSLNIAGASGFSTSHFQQISKMLFDILPKDPITPFSIGNSMQIIVISVLIGIVLLTLGEKTYRISSVIDESACVLQNATGAVCSLIPVFVFTELTSLIWDGKAAELLNLWKPLCIGIGLMLIYSVIMLLLTGWRTKRSPLSLLKIIFPAFMIGLTTASSVATLSTSMDICEKKLGVNRTLLNFVYPIGNVICKYSTLSFVCIICVSLASTYDVKVTIPWLIMAIFTSTLLTSAVAPVPGAILTIYTILLAQLGIPPEGVLVAVTLDIIIDYIGAGFNTLFLILETTSAARRVK